jgi:hypothetical protein
MMHVDAIGEPTEAPTSDVLGATTSRGHAARIFLAARLAVADLEVRSLADLGLLTDEQAASRLATLDLSVRLFWARWVESPWSARLVWLDGSIVAKPVVATR